MENIIIPVKSKSDSKFLMELVEKFGFTGIAVKKNDKMFYRFLLTKVVEAMQKKGKPRANMKEIQKEIDLIRHNRYDARKKN